MQRLFHFAPTSDWDAFVQGSHELWEPASLRSEGFVHLSFAEQLSGTLEIHFQNVEAVYLLEIEHAAVEELLRVEPSRGGQLFPHVYGALPRRAVRGWWELVRADGWKLPRFGATASEDEPQASPLST